MSHPAQLRRHIEQLWLQQNAGRQHTERIGLRVRDHEARLAVVEFAVFHRFAAQEERLAEVNDAVEMLAARIAASGRVMSGEI